MYSNIISNKITRNLPIKISKIHPINNIKKIINIIHPIYILKEEPVINNKKNYFTNFDLILKDSNIKSFLEKSKEKAYIVSSSKAIKRDDDNPPSYRAKNVYIKHLKEAERFKCTAEYPNENNPKPLTFKITGQGLSIKSIDMSTTQYNSFTQKSYGGK